MAQRGDFVSFTLFAPGPPLRDLAVHGRPRFDFGAVDDDAPVISGPTAHRHGGADRTGPRRSRLQHRPPQRGTRQQRPAGSTTGTGIVPHSGPRAGMEWATGIFSNPVAPGDAARRLRDALCRREAVVSRRRCSWKVTSSTIQYVLRPPASAPRPRLPPFCSPAPSRSGARDRDIWPRAASTSSGKTISAIGSFEPASNRRLPDRRRRRRRADRRDGVHRKLADALLPSGRCAIGRSPDDASRRRTPRSPTGRRARRSWPVPSV